MKGVADPGAARIERCLFLNNVPTLLYANQSTNVVVRRSVIPGADRWPGAGNREGDPLFVNPARGDFRLREESTVKGWGAAVDSLPPVPVNVFEEGSAF